MTFAELLAPSASSRHPPRPLHHLASARLHPGHRGRHRRRRRHSATTCICPCRAALHACSSHGARVHPRDGISSAFPGSSPPSATSASPRTSSSAFPARLKRTSKQTVDIARRGRIRCRLRFQVFAAAQHAGHLHGRQHPGRGKIAAACTVLWTASARFSVPITQKHLGRSTEVMVEGRNEARGQLLGRHSQNKTVNFTTHAGRSARRSAAYVNVRITKSVPQQPGRRMMSGSAS